MLMKVELGQLLLSMLLLLFPLFLVFPPPTNHLKYETETQEAKKRIESHDKTRETAKNPDYMKLHVNVYSR